MTKGICPICNKDNQCALVLKTDPKKCWCMNVEVPEGLLDKVPEKDKGKSCICKSCVELYKSRL